MYVIIVITIIIRLIKCLRPWLQRCWQEVSRGCVKVCVIRYDTVYLTCSKSKALRKKYVLSLDLNTNSESALIIVSGNEFQTVAAE